MRRLSWLVLIFILATACTPATDTAVSPQPSAETAVLSTATVPPPIITQETPRVEVPAVTPTPSQSTEGSAETAFDVATSTEPVAVETVVETDVVSGRTEEGAFFFGDPNAPITHIDYSDFL